MCIYCSYRNDGWEVLLQYDDTYQNVASKTTTQSEYGFYESWDDLRDQVTPPQDADPDPVDASAGE